MLPTSSQESEPPFHPVTLVIDETTAHVTAPSGRADELLALFQTHNISCRLQRRGGICGLDLIDFGDPAPAVEKQIRALFDAWRDGSRR
jgi:hypothetical protein